ncbi:MAG: nucleoside monophosphate kinase [Patescibacteria group bacterium]
MAFKKKIYNFILLGPQGCGKGTQARLLLNKFKNLSYISSGDLFRKLSNQDSDAGKRVKKVVNSGGLPIDDIAITLWMHEILFNVKVRQGILLDGAPRRVSESKDLNELFDFLERKKNTIVFIIDISEEESIGRLTKRRMCKKCGQIIPWVGKYKELKRCDKCGGGLIKRIDDDIDGIKMRLKLYKEQTVPAINYLKEKKFKVTIINGEQSIENVFKDILNNVR